MFMKDTEKNLLLLLVSPFTHVFDFQNTLSCEPLLSISLFHKNTLPLTSISNDCVIFYLKILPSTLGLFAEF